MGLRMLTYGGIYLVGGLSNGLVTEMKNQEGSFLKEYFNNRLENVLKDIPIVLVNIVELGLLGSYVEAVRLWQGIDFVDNS